MITPRPADLSIESTDLAPDAGQVRRAHAVVVFESADGTPSLIGVTADARTFIATRLLDDRPSGRTANHRETTTRVLVWETGSMFESELLYLPLARTRLPTTYQAVTTRWRAWFAHVEPDSTTPRWVKTHLLEQSRDLSTGELLGPLPDKDAAGRFIEAVIDAFDLCRFEHILAQAPSGEACAYKEMGRCPAPCDGSETMDDYRARTTDAVRFLAASHDDRLTPFQDAMHNAAAALDFERAERTKKLIDRLAQLDRRSFRLVDRIGSFRWIIAAPAGKAKTARLFLCDMGRWRHLRDIRTDADDIEFADVTRSLAKIERTPRKELADAECETISLVCRWLFVPLKRRTCRFIRWRHDDPTPGGDAIRALAAARTPSAEEEPSDFEVSA